MNKIFKKIVSILRGNQKHSGREGLWVYGVPEALEEGTGKSGEKMFVRFKV